MIVNRSVSPPSPLSLSLDICGEDTSALAHTRTHTCPRHRETKPLTGVGAGCRHGHFENWFLPVSSAKLVRSTAMKESAKRDECARKGDVLNTVIRY